MNITATLFAQIAAFVLLIWLVNKVLWGPVTRMLAERQQRIADGLAAAEKGQHDLKLAENRAKEILHEAKTKASEIIAQAEKRGTEIIEEAKAGARVEGERLINAARGEIERELNQAREHLRGQLSAIAVAGAGRVLQREIDPKAHAKLLNELAEEI